MSVILVILGFGLISLSLVHINLHQKKNELYKFIQKIYNTLSTRHKKIAKIIDLAGENSLTAEIKAISNETLKLLENAKIEPCQMIKAEILIEEKMKNLILELEKQEISEDMEIAIKSYKATQKIINKNKETYNKIIAEFMEACSIKPAGLYATFEKIDTDYPRLLTE